MLKTYALGTMAALGVGFMLSTPTAAQTGSKDIVETAVAAGSFKTLTQALDAAGLVEASCRRDRVTAEAGEQGQ